MKKSIGMLCISLIMVGLFATGCKTEENKNKAEVNPPKTEIKNDNKEDKDIKENKENKEESPVSKKEDISIEAFIPKGQYKVEYDGSDLAPNIEHIKGNGKSYQIIGTSGKGPFINVYSIKDNKLYMVYESSELTEDEIKNMEKIDYLNKSETLKEKPFLSGPIVLGTKWDNKEVVEVGKNLELENIKLKGAYIKTWEKQVTDKDEIVWVRYYSEGLGCVKYTVSINGSIVEHSALKTVNKL